MLDKNYKKNFQGKTKELMRQMLYGWWTQKFDNAVDVYDSINVVKLERYVFDSLSRWKKSVSLKHPTIQFKASFYKQAKLKWI